VGIISGGGISIVVFVILDYEKRQFGSALLALGVEIAQEDPCCIGI